MIPPGDGTRNASKLLVCWETHAETLQEVAAVSTAVSSGGAQWRAQRVGCNGPGVRWVVG